MNLLTGYLNNSQIKTMPKMKKQHGFINFLFENLKKSFFDNLFTNSYGI